MTTGDDNDRRAQIAHVLASLVAADRGEPAADPELVALFDLVLRPADRPLVARTLAELIQR